MYKPILILYGSVLLCCTAIFLAVAEMNGISTRGWPWTPIFMLMAAVTMIRWSRLWPW